MQYDNKRVLDIISKVGALVRQALVPSATQLTEIEALRFELLEVRVDWQKMLAEKQNQMLYPKTKEMTELDRKTMLNASLADIVRDVEFLVGLEKLVEQRIELGKSLL